MQGGVRTIHRLKGMDESPFPEEDTAERIVNLTVDESGVWKNARYPSQDIASGRCCGAIAWWGQRGIGRQWFVLESVANMASATARLVALQTSDGASVIVIQDGRQRMDLVPTAGTSMLPIGRWLYVVNGYDAFVRWNGSDPAGSGEVVQVGFPTLPPSPRCRVTGAQHVGLGVSSEPNNGIGPDSSAWKYGYAVTWVNDVGCESPPSPLIIVSGTNASGTTRAYMTIDLPDAPEYVRQVRIYRTVNLVGVTTAAGERYSLYFLQEFTAGMRCTWADGVSDAFLGLELDSTQTGLLPSGVRLQASWAGCLWLAGSPSYPDRLFYSAPRFIEQFPEVNTFDVGGAQGGGITALHATKGALIVFKRRSISLVLGDVSSGFRLVTLTEDTGCAAPRAIVEVPGRGVLFLSDSGPMLLVGALANEGSPTRIESIGKQIRRTWDGYANRSNLITASAVLVEKDQEVLISIPGSADGSHSRFMFAYHYVHGWWSRRIWEANRDGFYSAATVNDHTGGVVFAAYGAFVEWLTASLVVIPGAIGTQGWTWSYRSNWIGDRLRRSSIVKIELMGQLSSDPNIDPLAVDKSPSGNGLWVTVATDRALIPDYATLNTWDSSPLHDGVVGMTKYIGTGETEYDIDTYSRTWADVGRYWLRPSWRTIPVAVDGDGFEFQFEIANPTAPSVGHVKLVGYAVEVMPRSISDVRQDTAATTERR